MNVKPQRSKLTRHILIGMIAGLVLGLCLNALKGMEGMNWIQTYLIEGAFEVGSKIFLATLKLLVVPLVFISLVCGSSALDDVKKLGSIGAQTLMLYVITTALAIALAIGLALIVQPGVGLNLKAAVSEFKLQETPSVVAMLIDLVPTNPIRAMVEAQMLQIIVFSLLFGITLSLVGESGKRIIQLFQDLNVVVLRMVVLLMWLAPFGVFCLMAQVFATQGIGVILPLLRYFLVVLFALALHLLGTYSLLLRMFAQLSPRKFFHKFKQVMIFAFSTSSSNATLPVTLEVVEKRIGVSNTIASFGIPLGATINMDGTAIMQGVATVFVSQVYGIDIGFQGYLMVILTATLASIGTAGVPGVGLVTLAMVFKQVNLPVEGIGLIIGVDRFLDMARTAVNVTGDGVVNCIVAKRAKQLDLETFNSP